MKTATDQRLPIFRLALAAAAAVALHGYHLGVEDGEIYIPAARKLLHPGLYPYAAEFFESHEHLSLFAPILAWTARLTHLSMDWTVFLWYAATLFLLLVSCWMLAAIGFHSDRARWCGVLVVAAVLTMPATNTGLPLMDPYLTARSFSTPTTLFALTAFLARRYWLAAALTVLTAAIHPQMAAYLVFLGAVLWVVERYAPAVRQPVPAAAGAILGAVPMGFHLAAAQGAYREALYSRGFYFLSTWTWYHWLGLLAPLGFLAWFSRGRLRGTTPAFARLSFALIPFGVIAILAAAAISSTHKLDMYARLQPLRCFHLITLVLMLLFAGVLGEYLGKGRAWVIPAILVPLAAGMFVVDYETNPLSPHIEWPWRTTSENAWVNALLWIRQNTPEDAVFAVDSGYFRDPDVDVHGFRAISERAALADYNKDGGVVAIFPNLADEWKQMSSATGGLNHFSAQDFTRLAHEYPVTWTAIHGPAPAGMDCPYQQRGYAVCKIPGAPGLSRPRS
ncbi:MAG: hypothetical protein WBE38_09285 [Terracidiphilus sp.]